MAEVIKSRGQAIAALRQEGVISINEARLMLGYEILDEEDANDPFYLSPKLAINKGADSTESGDSEPEEVGPDEGPEEDPTPAIEDDREESDKVWF
jgi:hypothetical protein